MKCIYYDGVTEFKKTNNQNHVFHSLRFCRGLLRDDDHATCERPYEGMCDCVFRLLGCSDIIPLWKSLHSLNHLLYVTLYDAWGSTEGIFAD